MLIVKYQINQINFNFVVLLVQFFIYLLQKDVKKSVFSIKLTPIHKIK